MGIELAIKQLVLDVESDIDGIVSNEGVHFVDASLLMTRYKLVKTYAKQRNAWLGNGHRNKDGTWEGHRHPAARFLLSMGWESSLQKTSEGWKLVVLPIEKYLEAYKKANGA